MDFCLLAPMPFRSNFAAMSRPAALSGKIGERDRIRYGAMAFWAVVVVLVVARVTLLDLSKIRPGQGSDLAPGPSVGASASVPPKIL
jgi:hypothetical protein